MSQTTEKEKKEPYGAMFYVPVKLFFIFLFFVFCFWREKKMSSGCGTQ